ncbi:SDR family oxidoreductase [Celeribacter indicus]|uniref:Short chain dehydrogenase n=1 Tax=Celeribacter indicus TaxID=1208324 RepID=A0A0B5DQL8_9RHOB|nr:SDR family oxidoreductase [Celeribacter indicus]AJE45823.1 short chain dehydrogenase [Celeribacter indicus]SDW61522.1 glucose 1-dehydrogenase [Celeribacter indicus]
MADHTTETRQLALVTGGSGGIGASVATRLAADGFTVALQYRSGRDAAEAVAAGIAQAGGRAFAVQGDVAEEADIVRLFDAAEAVAPISVVVNCAGIMDLAPIGRDALDSFDRTIAANLRGTYLAMCGAARHMAEGGRFIAVSSSVVAKNFPGYGAYIASKLGVEGLVRVFANELRGRNITVNAVAPGPVATELFLNGKTDEDIARLAAVPPLERLGTPEDIAGAVSFLAGPDGAWINGQILRANGGFA